MDTASSNHGITKELRNRQNLKELQRTASRKLRGNGRSEFTGWCAKRNFLHNMRHLLPVGRDDHRMQVPLVIHGMTEGTQRKLAASPQNGEHRTLGLNGIFCRGIVELADSRVDGGIAAGIFGIQRVKRTSSLERKRSLAGCWGQLIDRETLMHVFRTADAVKPGAGEDQRVGLAFAPLAQARIDIAAHLDKLQIGSQGQQHGLATRAGRTDACP
jgi:hypothetical protein